MGEATDAERKENETMIIETYDRLGSIRTVRHRTYQAAQKRAQKFGDRMAIRMIPA